MKLAAIDIGSNAIRLQITNVIESGTTSYFKRVEFLRFPMRLGHDVFTLGKLSEQQIVKFLQLMRAFKILIDLYEVTDQMALATSALREASNGEEIIREVKNKTGLEIKIIPGSTEAKMINDAIQSFLGNEKYIHIDVGGGSTELNLYEDGRKTKSASFKIGSVRILEKSDSPKDWLKMENWVTDNTASKDAIIAIGTGGNINKFVELSGKKTGDLLSLSELVTQQEYVKSLSFEERQIQLLLNADRADVIVPASEIYISVMKLSHAKQILVPDVGLKDGIMKLLYQRHRKNSKNQIIIL